jgi:hypothetical protein
MVILVAPVRLHARLEPGSRATIADIGDKIKQLF